MGEYTLKFWILKTTAFEKHSLKCTSSAADTLQYKHSNITLYTEHYLEMSGLNKQIDSIHTFDLVTNVHIAIT